MEKQERRRHKRCNRPVSIVYSIFNHTEQRAAVALNYNKLGMYFESDRPLPSGTTIVIRALGCHTADNRDGGGIEKKPSAFYCKDTQPTSEVCQELKTLVVAEVKRCDNCKDLKTERYGIGVQYIRPAV
jgi:hypothetical protein